MTLAEVQLEPSKFNDHWPFSYFYLHHFHFDLLNNYFFLDMKQQQQQDYQYQTKKKKFSLSFLHPFLLTLAGNVQIFD